LIGLVQASLLMPLATPRASSRCEDLLFFQKTTIIVCVKFQLPKSCVAYLALEDSNLALVKVGRLHKSQLFASPHSGIQFDNDASKRICNYDKDISSNRAMLWDSTALGERLLGPIDMVVLDGLVPA
jgi:hypothetical protein